MESKRNDNWSDRESEDDEAPQSSKEAPESPASEKPERTLPPVLSLGTIYEREQGPFLSPEPIFKEHGRSEPETAHGISPASPEAPETAKPTPSAAEQAHMQQAQARAQEANVADEEDDDKESDEEDDEKQRPEEDAETEPVEPAPDEETTPVEPASPVPPFRGRATVPPQPEQADEPPQPVEEPQQPAMAPEPSHSAVPPPAESTPVPAPTEEPETPQRAHQRFSPPPPPPYTGNRPPIPPPPPEQPLPPAGYPEPEAGRWQQSGNVAPQPLYGYNTAPSSAQPDTAPAETQRSTDRQRQKSVAIPVTVAALTGYFIGRRPVKRLEKVASTQQEEIDQLREKIAQFERQPAPSPQGIEQQNERLRQLEQQTAMSAPEGGAPQKPREWYAAATPFEEKLTPQPEFSQAQTQPSQSRPMETFATRPEVQRSGQTAEQHQPQVLIGEEGQQIVLQPGQRYERSAGGYGVIVDEHNRVVQNAIEYGEAYQHDRLPERQPTPFGAKDARFMAGAGAASAPVAGGGASGAAPAASPQLDTGQAPLDHSLPVNSASQTPAEEAQHLLNAPKPSPVVSAITSPWLWLAVGVLMIAFFAAATI